jgi:hypothetical protein
MDTQNPGSNKIPAIRTYAKDLEYTRSTKKTPLHHQSGVVGVNDENLHKSTKTFPARKNEISTKNQSLKNETPIKQINKDDSVKISSIDTKKTSFIANNEDAASATVITDTKKNRFNLFSAISSSISNWFSNRRQNKKLKAVPKYSVPDISHRKGVIQRATSTTGKSVASDFSQIHSRIKQRPEPIPEHEIHTIWTPDTETGYLLLEEPELETKSNVTNVQITPRKSILNQVSVPEEIDNEEEEEEGEGEGEEIIEENYSDSENVEEDFPEETTNKEIDNKKEEIFPTLTEAPTKEVDPVVYVAEKNVPKIEYTPVVAEPINIELVKSKENTSTDIKTEIQKKERVVVDQISYLNKFKDTITNLDTNTLAMIVSSFILAVIVIIFIVNQFVNKSNNDENTPINNPETISLLQNTKLNLVKINDPKQDIVATLQSIETKNKVFEQFAFIEDENTNKLVEPTRIFESTNINLEPNFAQNISDVRFGYAKNNQPFVIIKVKDTTAAKGGMLMWEEIIYKDIINLFDIPQIQANDLTKFSDSSFGGKDVRIKRTEDGTELLLYGMINQTIIITTNNITFRELSLLIK